MAQEMIHINYDLIKSYTSNEGNIIGATTNTFLRTVPSYSDSDTKFVKKFGSDYAIGDITNAVINTPDSDGGGVNTWTYEFFGWNGSTWVSMGSVQDASGVSQAFSDGSAFAATKIKIVITCNSGAVTITDGRTINLTTDVDTPLVINLSGEGNTYTFNAAWGTLTLYLSASGSTYYDESYKYGGKRHTPTGATKYPYFDIDTAYSALGGAFDKVVILDIEKYDEDIDLDIANTYVLAPLGQTAYITRGIGARNTREVSTQYNNDNTKYFNTNGNDGTGDGTYQKPYLTIATAYSNRGTGPITYGGINVTQSGTYNEVLNPADLDTGVSVEPDYGLRLIIKTNGSWGLANYVNVVYYRGIDFDGSNNTTYLINDGKGNPFIYDCSFYNSPTDAFNVNLSGGEIERCLFYNNNGVGIYFSYGAPSIRKNIFYNNTYGIRSDQTAYPTPTREIFHNICYNNTIAGIHYKLYSGADIDIKNNTCFNNGSYGLYLETTAVWVGEILNNISYDNGTYDIYNTSASGNVTISYSNYSTSANITDGGNNTNADAQLCRESSPYKVGISSLSPSYKTDNVSDDMGAHLRFIEIGANSITLNGLIIYGQNYNNALWESATRTGITMQWCTVYDFNGIAFDHYATGNTSSTIQNCNFNNNGQGVALAYGGNTINECLFYRNSKIGLWLTQTGNSINHSVFYLSNYGIYFGTGTNGIFKNFIVAECDSYSIYSLSNVTITYSCITSAVNSSVDISSVTNKSDNPLFINTTAGSENFYIKTINGGYVSNSPCYQASDDTPVKDIGAYDVSYSLTSYGWKKYILEYNPRKNDIDVINPKGQKNSEDAFGNIYSYGKSNRKLIPLDWADNSAMSYEQRKKLEYFGSKRKNRENNYSVEDCYFFLQLRPDTYKDTGTNATIDATNKTLVDSTKSWGEDDNKGYHVAIVFKSGINFSIDASAKTLTKVNAFIGEDWTGYFLFKDNFYFYILSNTDDVLTLSDPYNNLTDTLPYAYEIVNCFRINDCDKLTYATTLNLRDTEGLLIDGTYNYYIDYILCKVKGSKSYNQKVYDINKEFSKTGNNLTFEEVNVTI